MGGTVSIKGRVHKRCNYSMKFLRRLGLGRPGSKYMPRWLCKESVSVREHFLAGLIDSDGCREQQRHPFKTNSNDATSTWSRQVQSVSELQSSSHCHHLPCPCTVSGYHIFSFLHTSRDQWTHFTSAKFFIKLQPCHALTIVLSL